MLEISARISMLLKKHVAELFSLNCPSLIRCKERDLPLLNFSYLTCMHMVQTLHVSSGSYATFCQSYKHFTFKWRTKGHCTYFVVSFCVFKGGNSSTPPLSWLLSVKILSPTSLSWLPPVKRSLKLSSWMFEADVSAPALPPCTSDVLDSWAVFLLLCVRSSLTRSGLTSEADLRAPTWPKSSSLLDSCPVALWLLSLFWDTMLTRSLVFAMSFSVVWVHLSDWLLSCGLLFDDTDLCRLERSEERLKENRLLQYGNMHTCQKLL